MHDSISEKIIMQIHNCSNIINRERNLSQIILRDNSTIGRVQGVLLRILYENDGLTQKELASQLKIRAASLGELVSKLEQNGYVQRRVNEKDKRILNVYITEKGRSICSNIVNLREKSVESWCSGLSENEKEQLSTLLEKLISSMEENTSRNENDFDKEEKSPESFPIEPGREQHEN